MNPGSAETPNRSRWMRAGRECRAAGDWAGAIRSYGQGLMEQPLLGMHYAANLERARTTYRQERQQINQQGPEHTTVVVAAAELSHNAAGRAYTLAQLYRHLGHPVTLLGSHFPQWGRELWEPIRGAVRQQGLPVHSFVGGARTELCEPGLGAGAAAAGGSGAPEQATAAGGGVWPALQAAVGGGGAGGYRR